MKSYVHLWQCLAEFSLEWEKFQTKVVEKIKTNILCSLAFSENCAICDITSENVVEMDRPHKTI